MPRLGQLLLLVGLVAAVTGREASAAADRDQVETAWKKELAERTRWWSLQPPKMVEPPSTDSAEWAAEPVDRFVLAKLEVNGLKPAPAAEALVLLRRLSLVLTGLPPGADKVDSFPRQFERDPDLALARLVDELLAAPQFGERFARHWMDVVRYTDTYGYEWDIPAKGSWEYRDYLIRAFNDDIGFDQLIREQIAGDLLRKPRINGAAGVNESMVGPMFYHLGEHRHGSSLAFNGIHQEMIDNKIDAFSKTFLAMTVACARCHDHKLDAISQKDYYALAGVFMTPRWMPRSIDAPDQYDKEIARLKRLRTEIRNGLAEAWGRVDLRAGRLRQWLAEHPTALVSRGSEEVAHPFREMMKAGSWAETELRDLIVSAKSGALEIESDGRTVIARGEIPATDHYTAQFWTGPGAAEELRLEALTHESLGKGGPGRTAHGNFVLSRIRVMVRPEGGQEREVILAAAKADYSQPNYPVSAALDSSATGWGVGLGGNVDRIAWFTFAEPVNLPKGGEWKVVMEFRLGGQHILGRFRLAIGRGQLDAGLLSDAAALRKWKELSDSWSKTRATRLKNNEKFTLLTDFSKPGFPDGWVVEGTGMKHGYVRDGAPLVSLEGTSLVSRLLARGYHTHALSSKLPGAVRAPDPRLIPGGRAWVKIAGGEWAGRLAVPQNALLNEGPLFFDPAKPPQWSPVDASAGLSNGVTRVLTEFVTASLNPNFPPRTGVARSGKTVLPATDEGFEKRSWMSVVGIAADNAGAAMAETLDQFEALYEGGEPSTSDEVWKRMSTWLADAVGRWRDGRTTSGDVKVLNWMLTVGLLPNDTKAMPELALLVDRYREVEARIGFARSANSMDERALEPVNYRLNVRGDVYQEGDPVRRDFLEAFAGKHGVGSAKDSGRLELAKYLSSPGNPQTARVYVNRVWQWVFGKGIVRTPSDFGKLGDRPSHPELLDWLAIQFVNEGWSTKKLVRRLVLSRAFLQSGDVSTMAAEKDPANRLLHHYTTRRLEAEAIRDAMLAASGRLDARLYGRPINPPRRAEDAKKRLFAGPLDSRGRRSLYQEMSIMQPPEFLVGFNLPDLKLPTGCRDETNVPAQALTLLNDPLALHLAGIWADKLLAAGHEDMNERIVAMFQTAFGRGPGKEEAGRWLAAAKEMAGEGALMEDRSVWAELAHTVFNTKEFIYYR